MNPAIHRAFWTTVLVLATLSIICIKGIEALLADFNRKEEPLLLAPGKVTEKPLEIMTYRELQAKAKELGVKASGKKTELLSRLQA